MESVAFDATIFNIMYACEYRYHYLSHLPTKGEEKALSENAEETVKPSESVFPKPLLTSDFCLAVLRLILAVCAL
jgi:hypothetical protein